MNMIRHDYIANNVVPFAFQMIKPLVDDIIALSKLKKWQPFVTGKSDEVNSIIIRYSPFDTQEKFFSNRKISLFVSC